MIVNSYGSPSTDYPTIWHFAQAWPVLICPDEATTVSKRDVQIFWRNYSVKRLLPRWESLDPIEIPPRLAGPFSASAALSVGGAISTRLRDYIGKHIIAKNIQANNNKDYGAGKASRRLLKTGVTQLSHWVKIYRSLHDCFQSIPPRVATPEMLFSFFQEKRDAWEGYWNWRLSLKNPKASPVPPSGPRMIGSVARTTRRLLQEAFEEGKGLIADKPCSNCVRRNKTCWLHIDDKLGKCLDCMRGLMGAMKVQECGRSRGVTEEEFATRPFHPFKQASKGLSQMYVLRQCHCSIFLSWYN